MPAAAIAIPALISAGGSYLKGRQGAGAARDAANLQTGYAGQAIETVDRAVNQANPLLESAAATSIEGVVNTADQAATDVTNTAARAGQNLLAGNAEANALLDPFFQAGQGGLHKLSELMSQEFKFDPNEDPGYQFRLTEGQKALERSAAARGGAMGGAALKSLARYSQGVASQEYQNAFDRFRANRGDRAQIAGGLANMGLTAGNRMGQNTLGSLTQVGNWNNQAAGYAGNMRSGAAQYAGNMNFQQAHIRGQNTIRGGLHASDALQGIGNSQAAGRVGAANAWGTAINDITNTAAGAASQYFGGGELGTRPWPNQGRIPGLPPEFSIPGRR